MKKLMGYEYYSHGRVNDVPPGGGMKPEKCYNTVNFLD